MKSKINQSLRGVLLGRRGSLYALLLLLLVHGLVHAQNRQRGGDDELSRKKKTLTDIETRLKQKKEELSRTEKKEQAAISQLDAIDKKLSESQNQLSRLNSKLGHLTTEALSIDSEVKKIEQRLAAQESQLQSRLVALYKFKRSGGVVRTVFDSRSSADLSRKIKYLLLILGQDREIIGRMEETRALKEQKKGALMENQEALKQTRSLALETESRVSRQKQDKSALLQTIRSEKELHRAAVRELEQSSRQLQTLIDDLEKRRVQKREQFIPPAGKGFEALRGSLPPPVSGRIISRFGNRTDPELNTVFFQKGIEMAAGQGESVRTIYNGKVLYADWFKGYGNMMIVDHGDGYYSLSAHLSEILKKVGEQVAAGEVIALAGDTGSLRGPCLYFELRHHGAPLDPSQWLKLK
jgi:septal ring factor EnvC (AmiA/AmiB activator)